MLAGELQLPAQRLDLRVRRREVAVEVEPDLADRHEAASVDEAPQRLALLGQSFRLVRVSPATACTRSSARASASACSLLSLSVPTSTTAESPASQARAIVSA